MQDVNERIKTAIAATAVIYPVFVGLYAAGFFWSIPTDVIGAFTFADFILRSIVVYSIVCCVFLIWSLSGTLLLFVIERKEDPLSRADNSNNPHVMWQDMYQRQRAKFITSFTALIVLLIVVWIIDPPSYGIDPQGFTSALFLVMLAGMGARPFLDRPRWIGSVIIYCSLCVIVAPLLAGYLDSIPSANAARVDISGKACPIILTGSSNTLALCERDYVVLQAELTKSPLIWRSR